LKIIEWFKSDIKIDFIKSFKYKLNNAEEKNGIKSYLIIKEVNADDFGNFSCKASNVYGSSTANVNLKPKGFSLISIQTKNKSNKFCPYFLYSWRNE